MTPPVWMFLNLMPRWKRPEAMPTKAMRSRCFGSILACTLNTKPTTSSFSGGIGRGSAGCRRGARASSATLRSSSRTPKLLSPLPKIDWGQMARAIELKIEGARTNLRHLDLLVQFGEGGFRQQRRLSRPLQRSGSTTRSWTPGRPTAAHR
jgi:hypothetical protein